MSDARDADVVVVGAGIVGLATAAALADDHGLEVVVCDKEPRIAAHQTGHNSGVIHSGIYYRPGSEKARLVARGRDLLLRRCDEHAIPYELCGKVIVATTDAELPRLRRLEGLAAGHGIATRRLDRPALREIEPHADGLAALHVHAAGIVDFGAVCRSLADGVQEAEGSLVLGRAVLGIDELAGGVRVRTTTDTLHARAAVNCAGLHADRVARAAGAIPPARITPFRGEYHELTPAAQHLVRHLIYPVPDPEFPFLGVHFTRMIDGNVHAGPNAVLALAREGYRWRDVDAADLLEMARDPGLWRLARTHWRTGLMEVARSVSKRALVRALRRLVPDVSEEDLVPSPAGVRAQALDPRGSLLDDFAFADGRRVVHVVNAPSPAATASLAIGEEIARRVLRTLERA